MNHQESYRQNNAYAEFLAGWDPRFYGKYRDTLLASPGPRLLDVGCGVGQVVHQLDQAGREAHGIDVSEPNIQRARLHSQRCSTYDGTTLPFPDRHFDGVGALNVLEHVDEPERFIAELARVTRPGGRLVLSSPNFLRVLGLRDYHPRMRGLTRKFANARRLLEKRREFIASPESVRFDRMPPIVKEPFTPDDDAIIVTNPLEMKFFLERSGCEVESVSCADRYILAPLNWLLNCSPLRLLMFNAFIIARRRG